MRLIARQQGEGEQADHPGGELRQGRDRLRRIEIQPHGADMTIELVHQRSLGKIERKRKHARKPRESASML